MVWDKCCFCHDLSVILCQNLSFVQKMIKIQHFAVNYGRIVVIDFRNAKTLPLRKFFTRVLASEEGAYRGDHNFLTRMTRGDEAGRSSFAVLSNAEFCGGNL